MPNHVAITRYGHFGVARLTTTIMIVEIRQATIQELKPSEIGRTPISIRRYKPIPLMIPAIAPYSFARFQNSPRSKV